MESTTEALSNVFRCKERLGLGTAACLAHVIHVAVARDHCDQCQKVSSLATEKRRDMFPVEMNAHTLRE